MEFWNSKTYSILKGISSLGWLLLAPAGEPQVYTRNGKEARLAESKIALVYFSATNVTHTYAGVMKEALLDHGCEVRLFDVTAHASRREPLPIDDFDGFIFGFPVFRDFAPSVINAWLPTLDGKGKRCALFLTYGGRTTGYAHFHTKLLLEQAGFHVLFSGEFLGRHSFNVGGWRILPDRPNAQDFALAREYAALAIERFSQDSTPLFRLQKPFGYTELPRSKLRGIQFSKELSSPLMGED